jgi:ATP-dependent protease ClpP protease subunit
MTTNNDNCFSEWTHPTGAGWFNLTGSIDAVSAGNLTASILNWLEKNTGKGGVYVIYLNSVGGNVHDAIAIREMINLLRRQEHKVVVVILRAASCANIVATAADEVYMGQNSWWMTHSVKSQGDGDAADLQAEASICKKLNDQTMWMIASPQLSAEQLTTMVKDEGSVWLNATQCWEHGLINGILKEPPIAARRPNVS